MAYTPITEGATNWDDPVNAAFTDHDTRITAAQATADLALSTAGTAPARPLFGALDSSSSKVIWGGTAGHGYADTSDGGGVNLNDTSDPVIGSQSITLATIGTGVKCAASIFGGPTMDMRDKIPAIWLRVTGQANVLDFKFWIGSGGLANGYRWQLKENPAAWPFLREGQWVRITLPIGKATVLGTPDPRVFTDVQLDVYDNSAGAVTVGYGGLEFIPRGQAPVISLTFDDNLLSQYTTAKPYLDKYGYKGTLYPISGILKDPANPAYTNYFKLAELKKFQNQGWEVGVHADSVALHNQTVSQGGTGANGYTAYASAAQLADMREAKQYLIGQGFLGTDHFAWPQGAYDEAARTNANQLFTSARGLTNPTWESTPVGDRLNIRCIGPTNVTSLATMTGAVDQAIAGNEWLVFCFHSIVTTPATPQEVATADFQALVDYIASKGVAVRTVGEVMSRRGGLEYGKVVNLRDGSTQFLRVNIPDDALSSSGPDRLAFWFGDNTRTFALNEYGEGRARPGKQGNVAFRVLGWGAGGGSSGDVFQVTNGANSLVRFRVSETDAESVVPFKHTSNYETFNGIRFYVDDADPDASAPNGSVWIDTTNGVIKRRTGGAWV